MQIAKATDADMDAALTILRILGAIAEDVYPSETDDPPYAFDPEDPSHLRALYDQLMGALWASPGALDRIVWGYHTIVRNQVLDPGSTVLRLHPRFRHVREVLDAAH